MSEELPLPQTPVESDSDSDTDVNPVSGQDIFETLAGVNEPENALPPLAMADLPESIREAVTRMGWQELMPVQAMSLPYSLAGRDLMIQSRTGSGKTGAFLLPLLESVDGKSNAAQALILVPTRELALQVAHEAKVLLGDTKIKSAALYGGVGYGAQLEALRDGAQVIIGTPGRVLDHLLRRTLSLEGLRCLVFDEADRMLSIGFYPDMKEVSRYLPQRRVPAYMFSATFPVHVLRLAAEFMHEPQMLSLSHKEVHIALVDHVYYQTDAMGKDRALVRILEMESPGAAMIFCNTRSNVHYVTAVLRGFGYNADALCSDLTQSQREEVLTRVRGGETRFLVATDVAARGIDIADLSHVILYEPPEDPESYIHRAGRTGRAGAGGTVISLVDIMEKLALLRIAKHYKINIVEQPTPDDSALRSVVEERLTALLEAKLRQSTGLQKERFARFLPLVRHLVDNDDAETLAMLLDEYYQQALHGTLPTPAPMAVPSPAGRAGGGRGPSSGGGGSGGGGGDGGRRRRSRRPRGGSGSGQA